MSLLKKIFGDYSSKEVKRVMPIQKKVLAYEEEYSRLSDEQLKAKTDEFKKRLADGETLDDILPEAFATCREASWRVLNMKHFPVQIIGGIILHQGRIAEMKTGEGKTLVATLPAYLNALSGKGVHIVTVNDYLARRDSEWMGKVFRFLGLSVGLIVHELDNEQRREAYNADIPTARTTRWALTIFVTRWLFTQCREFSVAIILRLSMRLTQFLSTRRELRLSFRVQATSQPTFIKLPIILLKHFARLRLKSLIQR